MFLSRCVVCHYSKQTHLVAKLHVAFFTVELKDAELKDAVNDLFVHMEKQEERDEEEKTHKTQELVEEPVITSSELLPLGDLKTTLPPEKSLLNARVVFVIGKAWISVFNCSS